MDVALLLHAVLQRIHDFQAHGRCPSGWAVGAGHRLAAQLADGAKTGPSRLEEVQCFQAPVLPGQATGAAAANAEPCTETDLQSGAMMPGAEWAARYQAGGLLAQGTTWQAEHIPA